MGRCPSPQQILTASILRQKWIDAVVLKVHEAYDRIDSGQSFEKEIRKLHVDLAEMASVEAQKRNHFKGRSSLLRAFQEALEIFSAARLEDGSLQHRLLQALEAFNPSP